MFNIGGGIRGWVFRVLVLAAGGLLLYTWFLPWWQAYIEELKEIAIIIRPWAFDKFVPPDMVYLIAGVEDAMPAWFFTFMWVYLGAVVLALLVSLFVSSAKGINIGRFRISLPTALIGAAGLSYIGVVIAAVIVISMKAGMFWDAPLQGKVYVEESMEHASYVMTSLQTGFYLACATGPILVVLAILRRFIVGKA